MNYKILLKANALQNPTLQMHFELPPSLVISTNFSTHSLQIEQLANLHAQCS